MYVLVCIIVHMYDPLRDRTVLIIFSFNIRMYDWRSRFEKLQDLSSV